MARGEGVAQERAKLIAAAHAAASWARARRATWTNAPLPPMAAVAAASVETSPPPSVAHAPPQISIAESSPTAVPPPLLPAPDAERPVSRESPWMSRAIESVHSIGTALLPWLPHVVVLALLVAAAAGGFYLRQTVSRFFAAPFSMFSNAAGAREPTGAARSGGRNAIGAAGGLRVDSTPSGARVYVDGKIRGVTPLTLADVPRGAHTVELESGEGRIRRSVTVSAGEQAAINEMIFGGWLAVYAPFDLLITEGDQSIRLDDRSQVMLAPGPHQLRIRNAALGFEQVRDVELKPGEITTLSITPPRSALTISGGEPAEVWLDGERIGEIPLSAFPVDLGTHEIVVKRGAGGERRYTVTITTKPFTLDVDSPKP